MPSYFDLLAPIYDFIIRPKKPKELLEKIDFSNITNFIEIGGGTGRFAQYFASHVNNTWILDPSVHMLKRAEQKGHGFRLVNGIAQKIPFPDDFFDLILIYDSLHHWNDHGRALDEVYRTLKEGQKVVIGEIHPGIRSGYFIALMEQILRMNSTFYQPHELIKLLESHGFSIFNSGWLHKPTYYVIATK